MKNLCEACLFGDHVNCGRQTWCECDCDPEAIVSDPFPEPGESQTPKRTR